MNPQCGSLSPYHSPGGAATAATGTPAPFRGVAAIPPVPPDPVFLPAAFSNRTLLPFQLASSSSFGNANLKAIRKELSSNIFTTIANSSLKPTRHKPTESPPSYACTCFPASGNLVRTMPQYRTILA
ncbi:unnamed protein product [Linum trigynum]|uniref:Uncharacterized protein n=1 Tax=Linum trigynum TaxID=586398 RepID=A0AAV2E015_9ROSI